MLYEKQRYEIEQQKLGAEVNEYLLYFVVFGYFSAIEKVIEVFCMPFNKQLFKDKPNIALFSEILCNSDKNTKVQNFMFFLSLIVKSIQYFKLRNNTPESKGIFISKVIEIALEQKAIYIVNKKLLYTIQYTDFSEIDLAKEKINNLTTNCNVDKTIENRIKHYYRDIESSPKKNDIKRYEVINRLLHNKFRKIQDEYCPFCTPWGIKNKKKRNGSQKEKYQCCMQCKDIFNEINEKIPDKKALKRIKENIKKTKIQGLPQEAIHQKYFCAFKSGLQREIERLKLRNVSINKTQEFEIIKKVKSRFYLLK